MDIVVQLIQLIQFVINLNALEIFLMLKLDMESVIEDLAVVKKDYSRLKLWKLFILLGFILILVRFVYGKLLII